MGFYSSLNDDKNSSDGVSKRLEVLKTIGEQTADKEKSITEIADNSSITRTTIRKHAKELDSEDLINLESDSDQDFTKLAINENGKELLELTEFSSEDYSKKKDAIVLGLWIAKVRRELMAKYDYEVLMPLERFEDKIPDFEQGIDSDRIELLAKLFDNLDLTSNISIEKFEEESVSTEFEVIGFRIPDPEGKRLRKKDIDTNVKYITKPKEKNWKPNRGLLHDLKLLVLAKLPWTNGLVNSN